MKRNLMRKFLIWPLISLLLFVLVGCSSGDEEKVLRLATTTSTDNSGLLDAILPNFEAEHDVRVDVIVVGTGQALKLGEAGDVDVVLVHARSREDEFVAAGHGVARYDVMYNDFVFVGPLDDPAGIRGQQFGRDTLARLASSGNAFASRGDDSGTHIKEQSLWMMAGVGDPSDQDWYKSLGQGMGDTLRFANEVGAYTMTDRGTFLALKESVPNLEIMIGGASIDVNADESLYNPYGIILVNPDKGNIAYESAEAFAKWLTSADTQAQIAGFGIDMHGQPLFYPNASGEG